MPRVPPFATRLSAAVTQHQAPHPREAAMDVPQHRTAVRLARRVPRGRVLLDVGNRRRLAPPPTGQYFRFEPPAVVNMRDAFEAVQYPQLLFAQEDDSPQRDRASLRHQRGNASSVGALVVGPGMVGASEGQGLASDLPRIAPEAPVTDAASELPSAVGPEAEGGGEPAAGGQAGRNVARLQGPGVKLLLLALIQPIPSFNEAGRRVRHLLVVKKRQDFPLRRTDLHNRPPIEPAERLGGVEALDAVAPANRLSGRALIWELQQGANDPVVVAPRPHRKGVEEPIRLIEAEAVDPTGPPRRHERLHDSPLVARCFAVATQGAVREDGVDHVGLQGRLIDTFGE
mmetsp:Transcript_101699/g.270525  ORF Transcript_101699/g.270525 Transcript_101699/m.270525 type:complete len:343 (+) Transcript_101699:418-1446(+)